MQNTNVLIRETETPQIIDLSRAEDDWLGSLLAIADARGHLEGVDALSEAFDAERDEWAAQPHHQRPSPGKYINLYAVAFGQQLAQDYDLDWVGLQKGAGVQVALRGGLRPLTLLPISMVEKRWHDPACRPLSELHLTVAEMLR